MIDIYTPLPFYCGDMRGNYFIQEGKFFIDYSERVPIMAIDFYGASMPFDRNPDEMLYYNKNSAKEVFPDLKETIVGGMTYELLLEKLEEQNRSSVGG